MSPTDQNSVEVPLSVMLKDRRSRLTSWFDREQLDCLVVESLPNLRYLTGFSGSTGLLVVTHSQGWFICDSRYTLQAHQEVLGLAVVEHGQRYEALAQLCNEHGWQRIGFEAAHCLVSTHQELLKQLPGATLVALPADLDEIRSSKDQLELQALEEVASLASQALQSVLPLIRPGLVEADLALELEIAMRRLGAEGRGFDFIVASGERGAMPHGRASGKQIQSGELVTIDFGAVLNGYHSDETVTIGVGQLDQRQQQIYDVVLAAHDRAIAAVRPGVSCRELDAVARDYIHEQGFGDFFGHGLGHGVGLEIHEKPTLSPRSGAVLDEGMVVTIEPGIYIPGWGGVRIEDTVAVTSSGCRLLTGVSKQLTVV